MESSLKVSPVVVASNGRAGSTMLTTSLVDAVAKRYVGRGLADHLTPFTRRLLGEFCQAPAEVAASRRKVIKTHCLYDASLADLKCIFVYSRPLDSAISVYNTTNKLGISWFAEHQRNVGGTGSFSDLFLADVLNYENQILSWKTQPRDNVFVVPYEAIWDQHDAMKTFLDIEFDLPKRREAIRELPADVKVNPGMFSKLEKLLV